MSCTRAWAGRPRHPAVSEAAESHTDRGGTHTQTRPTARHTHTHNTERANSATRSTHRPAAAAPPGSLRSYCSARPNCRSGPGPKSARTGPSVGTGLVQPRPRAGVGSCTVPGHQSARAVYCTGPSVGAGLVAGLPHLGQHDGRVETVEDGQRQSDTQQHRPVQRAVKVQLNSTQTQRRQVSAGNTHTARAVKHRSVRADNLNSTFQMNELFTV